MKILKKTITYMAAATMLLSSVSCSDFLGKAPENKLPEEATDFTNLNNMYEPVSGVYGMLRTGGMHWIGVPLYIVRDDDIWSGRHDDQTDLVNIGESFIYMDSFWGFNEMWNQNYSIVRVANAALEDLENFKANIPESDTENMQRYYTYTGEVHFLRAYAYYRLTQLFGDVVILRSNLQGDLTRSVRDVVYEYMLTEDLEYAIENLPKVRPANAEHPGAVTSYTAAQLAAKIYLQMGNYPKVKEMTEYIIKSGQFDLYPDYYNLFKLDGMLCQESLFECQITNFGAGSGDEIRAGDYYTFQGPVNSDPNSSVVSGWGFMGFRDEFVAWAEQHEGVTEADKAQGPAYMLEHHPRYVTTFLKGGETTPSGDMITGATNPTATNCWNGKAYLPANQTIAGRSYGSGNNIRIFRYADVLLMYAEACVRTGQDLSNALIQFNKVRTRAKVPEISQSELTVETILDERRMELACEWGDRYMDLVRTGQAAQVLNEGADPDPSDNKPVINGWTEEKTYYPIPTTQIENAPDLTKQPLSVLTVQQ